MAVLSSPQIIVIFLIHEKKLETENLVSDSLFSVQFTLQFFLLGFKLDLCKNEVFSRPTCQVNQKEEANPENNHVDICINYKAWESWFIDLQSLPGQGTE